MTADYPPPINWSTKPKPSVDAPSEMPMCMRAARCMLGPPPLSPLPPINWSTQPLLVLPRFLETSPLKLLPSHLEIFPVELLPSHSEISLVKLHSPLKLRYYVVIVGKCASVHWDNWYFIPFCLKFADPSGTMSNYLFWVSLVLVTRDFRHMQKQNNFI